MAVPAADADRRGAAVVADRHPLVVRQQRVVGAELLADRGRVVDAGVEVGVVADLARHAHLDARPAAPAPRGTCASLRAAVAQTLPRSPGAARARGSRGELHQPVHVVGVDQLRAAQVEHLVADRDADPPVHVVGAPEAPERQVLDREVGRRVVGRFEPARQRRVVVSSSGDGHGLPRIEVLLAGPASSGSTRAAAAPIRARGGSGAARSASRT